MRVDAQANGGVEAVDVLAEFAQELAAGIELEQARAAAIERPVVAERGIRMAGAMVDEDQALRIGADTADLADVNVVGRLEEVGRREGQVGHAGLSEKRTAERENGRGHRG